MIFKRAIYSKDKAIQLKTTYNVPRQPQGRNHGQENPREDYMIRPLAELTKIERGSSATKKSQAVTNPRISE
jgi:hypothetical protein